MTVIDTSAVVDYLLGIGVATQVETMFDEEGGLAAPDVMVFEVLAVLRREAMRDELTARRAAGAVDDMSDLPIELFPSMMLRRRAWELRSNLTAADALFAALAEQLGEPLATKDKALAGEISKHSTIAVKQLETMVD